METVVEEDEGEVVDVVDAVAATEQIRIERSDGRIAID